MPHVVISGPVTPEDISLAFQPVEFIERGNRFKAEQAYLSVDRKELLVRTLVIERGYRKLFYVRMHINDAGNLHLGLDIMNHPDKSEAVRRLLGLYAWRILQAEPQAAVASTNIADLIKEPEA